MRIIPEEYFEDRPVSTYLNQELFDKGVKLTVVNFEKIKASTPDFGTNKQDWVYKAGHLGEGETFKYTFFLEKDDGREEVTYESKSAALFFAFRDANPELNETFFVKRTGEGKETRYSFEKIELDLNHITRDEFKKGVDEAEREIDEDEESPFDKD